MDSPPRFRLSSSGKPPAAGFALKELLLVLGGLLLLGWVGYRVFFDRVVFPAAEEFARLKNAGDVRAQDFLPPFPHVPTGPITPEEAGRLDAAIILHRNYKVKEVRPLKDGPLAGADRFVLVLEGGVSSETLVVRTPEGKLEKSQRVMSNPDVLVEVRDGRIHGLLARLHEE